MKQLLIVGAIFLVALFSIGLASGGLTGDNKVAGTIQPNNPQTSTPTSYIPQLYTTISGSGDLTSASFTIPTGEWQIRWSYVPDSSYCIIFYVVRQQSNSLLMDMKTYDSTSVTSGTNYEYFGPGTYYIEVSAANISSWTLQIYA